MGTHEEDIVWPKEELALTMALPSRLALQPTCYSRIRCNLNKSCRTSGRAALLGYRGYRGIITLIQQPSMSRCCCQHGPQCIVTRKKKKLKKRSFQKGHLCPVGQRARCPYLCSTMNSTLSSLSPSGVSLKVGLHKKCF